VLDGLQQGPATLLTDKDSHLDGLALVVREQEVEGKADGRCDDSEDTETPSPANAPENALGHGTGDPDGSNVGRASVSEHQTSVLELGGIGDEYRRRI